MESFTPILLEENYGIMLIQLDECYLCKKKMVGPFLRDLLEGRLFPSGKINFENQLKAVGWEESTLTKVDNKYICKSCFDAGLATFECDLCKLRYPTTEIQDSFGDPTEYLCKHCYCNVSAKLWNEEIEHLCKWDLE